MFRQGIDGFKGGLSAENYIGINKTSRATATRDLQEQRTIYCDIGGRRCDQGAASSSSAASRSSSASLPKLALM